MTMKHSYVTVLDQFCGAGGSSLGATQGGAEVVVALNHWQQAIETHNSNFPDTYHECTDISACDPRRYPATDILITSPECTNHTLAKGVARRYQQRDLFGNAPDPSAERSRATMWDVPRFAEFHNYAIIIVENVVEARTWLMWESWIHAMTVSLGYDYRVVYFNSMFAHPTPQSRDRMYVVFWKRGNLAPDLDFAPLAWCPRCEADVASVQAWKNPLRPFGRYRQQYRYCCPTCAAIVEPYYYAAANAIDWALPIERVGDRKHPLKDKTRARIQAGLDRFAGREALLFSTDQSVIHRNLKALGRDPFPAQTTATTMGMALPPVLPLGVPLIFAPGSWGQGHDAFREPMPTQVTAASPFLIDPGGSWESSATPVSDTYPTQTIRRQPGLVVPYIIEIGHGGHESAARVKSLRDALPTQTARQDVGLALAPFIAELHGTSNARGCNETLACVTAGGNHHGLVEAPFTIAYNGADAGAHAITDALGAQPSHDRHALVRPAALGPLPSVDDCYFRVLRPHEIQAAMAFPGNYRVLGTAKDRIKQLGNAVTPPVMRLILERCLASLRSERIA